MTKLWLLARVSLGAIMGASLVGAMPARAQDKQSTSPDTAPVATSAPVAASNQAQPSGQAAPTGQSTDDLTEVVVTGTLLGTPRNSALPVNVVSSKDLEQRGSPTAVELVKSLTIAAGTIGDSNQFSNGKGQRAEGTGTINLRGLGPERTLVLLDGHRLPLANGIYADILKIPYAAIERIEILKDGAAATYGSDAVAGVVNFITRKHFNGLDVGADYRFVNGSNGGDATSNALWGWSNERFNVLLSAGFQHRGELPSLARSFSQQPYTDNPENNWNSTSNPAQYLPVNSAYGRLTTQPITDVGCAPLGGVLTNPVGNATPSGFSTCRTQYVSSSDLVDEQTAYQFYGSVDTELTDTISLRIDGEFAQTDIPRVRGAPTFPVSRSPTATVLPAGFPVSGGATPSPAQSTIGYYIPATNPGFAAYVGANPGQFPVGATGALIQNWRPFGVSGNPLFPDDGASEIERKSTQYRFTASLAGKLTQDISWTVDSTFGQYDFYRTGYDSVTDRLELALRGLGGPGCNFQAGSPGVGPCMYFNPFSNAIARNSATGQTNPGYNSAVANDNLGLVSWMFPEYSETTTSRIFEYNAIVNGNAFELPGGKLDWAIGGQFRRNDYINKPHGVLNNVLYPCVDTPVTGSTNCTPKPTSSLALGGTDSPLNLSQNITAVFGEVGLPVFNWANADLAARYEDYGADGGSTFNPQARLKVQPLELLGLRGSIGTTFRAPPLNYLIPDPVTTVQSVFGSFRPVSVQGNPDLKPEKTTTYSLGTIFTLSRFLLTVDYWNIALKHAITSEPLTAVLTSVFPNNGNPATGNCAAVGAAYISAHFDFNGPCSAANVVGVKTSRINGPDINTDGVDIEASYSIPDVFGGKLDLSGNATFVHKYVVGDLYIGNVLAQPRTDLAGHYNSGNALAYPLPKWRASADINYGIGIHNVHATVRFVDSYGDNRAIFTPTLSYCVVNPAPAGCGLVTHGQVIGSSTLLDLSYHITLPDNLSLALTVANVFDRNPPFARTEIGYDALTGDPLGRTVKFGIQKHF